MKALVIAAGRGSRLNGLTKNKPKSLIPLLGVPLIERVVLSAKQAGIYDFVITVGYLGEIDISITAEMVGVLSK